MTKTLEQKRAEASWGALEGHFGNELQNLNNRGDLAKRYLTSMRQTATRVHVSGLGQSIAFLRSRKDEGGKLAANDLARLTLRAMGEQVQGVEPSLALIRMVQSGNLIQMMRATEEVMGLIAWFSRYLQGAGIEAGDTDDEAREGNHA